MRSFLKVAGLFLLLLAFSGLSFAETDVSGDISTDTVWDLAGSPYNVTNNVTVKGSGGLATLTIEPGVVVRFYPQASLFVGTTDAAFTDGKLDAQGTAAQPITFTTYYDGTKPVNMWRSIFFENMADDSSILDNCVVEYGMTAVTTKDASPTIQNSVIRNFSDYGLHAFAGSSPVFESNTVENVKSAMIVGNKGTGAPQFSNNTVDGCSQFGVWVSGPDALPQINNNSFTNVTDYIIFVYPNQVGGLWGNTQANNSLKKSMVYVTGGEVIQDATWQETDISLLLSNNVFVKGAGGSLVTLTINPGMSFYVEEHKGLYIGSTNAQEPAKLMVSEAMFTSARENVDPAGPSGFWYAIHFDASADDASMVDNCTFENSEHGMWVSGSSPAFTNNSVTNCANNGVFIKDTAEPTVSGNTFDTMPTGIFVNYDATGAPVISGNTIENCSNIALRVEGPTALPVISDNVFNGNDTFLIDLFPNQANNLSGSSGSANREDFDFLRIKAADYTMSGSWNEAEIGYFISGNVFIRGEDNPVLSIGEGAELNFVLNAGLYVGEPVGGDPGKLLAYGATFTSRKLAPAPGDWNAVVFDSTADATSLVDNCTFEYSITGVNVLGSAPTISNNTFSNVLNNAILVTKSSAPVISGNTFTDLPIGVLIDQKSTATPTITGNTFDDLTGIPIVTQGGLAVPVITENTFTNLNNYIADLTPNQAGNMSASMASDNDPRFNNINVRAGVLSMNSTWTEAEIGYFLAGDVYVAGNGAMAELSIDPGVGVYFFRNTGLWIGSDVAANSGKLIADQAMFTTFDINDPDPGEWDFIYFFDNASDESSLNGCTIEYARVGLELNSVAVDVQNTEFMNISESGINVSGDCDITVGGSTFDTMKNAINYNLAAVGSLDVMNNIFNNVSGNVIVIRDNGVMPMISGNTFTNNNNYLVLLYPDDAKYFTDNTYENNRLTQIYIQRGFITEDAVWGELGIAYYIFDDVFVEGADGMATLTIQPGVMVYFNNQSDLVIGSSLNGAAAKGHNTTFAGDDVATGKLMAKSVTFTTANQNNPGVGDWNGITLDELASDSSVIRRSTIEYAVNGIRTNYTHAFIEINTIQHILESNVYCYGGSPTVMYNDLLGGKRGVYAVLEGNPVVNYNNIENSTLFGVENTSDVNTVDAENNWWGRASGPAGLGPGAGSPVSDMVDFDPFLTSVFVPAFPPEPFSLLSPANGAVLNEGNILVDWEDAIDEDPGDVVTYTLYVSTSPTFAAAQTVEIPNITESQYVWSDALILNTPVYWKVKAVDTNSDGTESTESFTVTIQVLPPAPFSLLTPANNTTMDAADITFTWEETTNSELGGDLTYSLYLADNEAFTNAEVITGLTAATYTKQGVDVNETYYWKVEAVDENSPGIFSTQTFMVSTTVAAPEAFSLLTPADGSTSSSTEVTFTWEATTNSPQGGALTYTLYIDTDENFGSAEMVTGLTEASYTKSGLSDNTTYYWKVKAVDDNSTGTESSESFMLTIDTSTGIAESEAIPTEFSLSQNYPNPFNPVTTVKYGLPVTSNVKVTLHNSLGQEILTLVDGAQNAGYHTVVWNASSFGSGVYFIRINAGDFTSIKKAVLTK